MGAGGGSHGSKQHPAEDRGRCLGEAAHVKLEAGFGPDRKGAKPLVAQLIEPLPVFADQSRGPGNGGMSRTAGRTVQFWKDSVANPVARVVEVVVALILDPLFALRGQVGPESHVGHVKQGPDHGAAPWIDPRQAGETGATHQLEQEGFSLVILCVADRDPVRADVSRHTLEERVPEATRGVFDGKSVRLRIGTNICGLDGDRQTIPLCEMAAERLIPVGRRPEPMIQVSQAGHGELTVLGEIDQQPRQGHGVGSTGQPNQDARARGHERMVANGPANLLMKACHVQKSQ